MNPRFDTCFLGTVCMAFILSVIIPLPAVALSVRVQDTPGGPQIHVDGKPVPPRFFWGAMNSGHLSTQPEWSSHSFEFLPGDVDGTGTLHFRFSQIPGDVWLADVRIRDVKTGEDVLPLGSFATADNFKKIWNHWPDGDANTVGRVEPADGSLHVTLKNPPTGTWPDFHLHTSLSLRFVAGHTYRCTFRAKGMPAQDLRAALYNVSGGTWNFIGGPPGSFLSQVSLARDAGVNLISFAAPNCWTSEDKPADWAPLDNLCRQIAAVNPGVLLVPRMDANAPDWWLKKHPDARMVYDGNKIAHYSCVSDRAYRVDVCAHLETICRHLMEAFPDNFAGIHPCGQNTGEWFYQDSWQQPLSGYDQATKSAFRQWLRTHGDPQAESADVPSADERRAHPNGLIRDPAREMRLISFARFQQEEMADHVKAMAAACRKGTDGKKLVLFFYGYLFEFAPLQNGAPTSGHYALSSVLKSRDIDILCSPISYTDREWIGTAPSMTAAESVRNAGILWLNEDDSRTFLDPRKQAHAQEGGLVNLEQTRQVMLRNTAQAALRGFGTWWMDLPAQGWFNDARIWEELIRLHSVDAVMASRKQAFMPDIAAIMHEDSMCHLPGGSAAFARHLIYEGRAALGRCGAPYGQYLLGDVIGGKVPARLQIFLSAWAMSPAERVALAAKRSPSTTRVWCYAPGFVYPNRCDVAGIKEVTGFDVGAVNVATAEVTPSELGKKLGLTTGWGPKAKIQPLFSVSPAQGDILATYADGSAAVVVKRSPNGIDVFVGVPQMTPELVRALARIADVHVFTEGKATVWAAERYISLQAHETGPLVINTGVSGPVVDALDGKPAGMGPKVTMSLKQGETRVLKY